jgi:LysR family nitrogen assimilation transcriptional regulator
MVGAIDLRRLRYFRAIAESGSFSTAARMLCVAQPALSHHMAELERLLDVRLLIRSHQGVRMTEAGTALLRDAMTILDHASQAERSMKRFESDGSRRANRTIRIAVIPSLACGLTSRLAAAANRNLPGISLHLIEAGTQESHAMIASGAIDLAVNLNTDRHGIIKPLAWEELVFVSPLRPASGTRTTIRFADLARERLVLPSSGRPIRVLMEQVAESLGIELDVAMEIDGHGPSIRAVIDGFGSTVMAALSIADEHAAGLLNLCRIIEPPVTRQMVLECRPGFDPSLASQFYDLLKEHLQTLLLYAKTTTESFDLLEVGIVGRSPPGRGQTPSSEPT